ncbi:exonuclease [Xanthomonas phage XAJ2]|uniref:Exonuclease n=1 Tax=Xanthomonas phage XAJ2 TaxID=1775249 RepID=A0A1I9L2K9_9CAUD|nr:exonuclease [Xanthomonas phage XAJ2]
MLEEIDAYCKRAYDDGHRNHLGGSLIGHDCRRYLWYNFRWVLHTKFSGRMLRLFNRGHREEDRFVEWLRGAGFTVWTHDETKPKKADGTFPQFRIVGAKGHFGGSLDGIALFPPGWGIDKPVLLEFKTNGTGAGFNKLVANGMKLEKSQHFAQTCTYGADENYQFEWCLYMNINKNDDTIHVELVKLDWNQGKANKRKAEEIIESQTPPPRISENPTYYKCKTCDFHGVCHLNQAVEINCRSCKNAKPIENGEWICTLPAHINNGPIPIDVIKRGCNMHYTIAEEPGTHNVV